MNKARDCQLFMTTKDEKAFCKALREFNPNIYFLDTKSSFESDISKRLVDDVTKLNSEFFSIVNFDLINRSELSVRFKKREEYYHFAQFGRAQMQFLRSHPDVNVSGCLQHGRIADFYDKEDEEEKKWKNKVYSILKKLGQKVYWYYTLPDGTWEINKKPANNLVALPDAIAKYNGTSGNFMIHSRAKFVPEGATIDELSKIDGV